MSITSLTDLRDPARCPVLVVKLGSALLVGGDGQLRRDWLAGLVGELAQLQRAGQKIIIVSSGAIALGAAKLRLGGRGRASLSDAQAAASVGQVELAGLYSQVLGAEGLIAAQMLLTLDDLEDRKRYLNASATFDRLLDLGAVPVVNENDSVATEEIRFGDNDRLAARVAQAARADAVLLFSDVDGLYDRPPEEEGAQLIRRVDAIDEAIRASAGPARDGMGTGGMASKLAAAQIATRAGIALAIANGTHDLPFSRAVDQDVGTVFTAQDGPGARKGWLGGRLTKSGIIQVDNGCVEALAQGASVLAAGITNVSGDFARGDFVGVANPDGAEIALGLAEYDAETCRALAGKRQDAQAGILGHAPRNAVIHRDHLVML